MISPAQPETPLAFTLAQIRAFAVHVLTASGAAMALLALIAAAHAQWPQMFLWLGAALIVDGVDGAFARRYRVAEILPRWSGDALDFVVDFTTYVFVPAFAIAVCGLLPPVADVVVSILIVVSGAIYFADREMKMPGNFFRGFPALWNVAAFYVFLVAPPPWIGTLGLLLLVVLTFAPFRFIHPVRVSRWRIFNLSLLALWSVLALVAILQAFDPGLPVTVGLCITAVYFFAFGLLNRSQAASG
jgi:phosphatidylcholine synthase